MSESELKLTAENMGEPSLLLLTKFLPLLILFLFCQLHSTSTTPSLAPEANAATPSMAPEANAPPPSLAPEANAPPPSLAPEAKAPPPSLPKDEDSALQDFTFDLATSAVVSYTHCGQMPESDKVFINCSQDHQHVIEIIATNDRFNGFINAEVSQFKYLKKLVLSSNELSGTIPFELGKLSELERLDLSDNQLMGPIPSSLGNLKNLKNLDLSDNQLMGLIPSSLGNLKNLKDMDLSNNQLKDHIPWSLGNLKNLKMLNLQKNLLSGPIPPSFGNLPTLEELDLWSNKLSGQIPPHLGNLSRLRILSLDDNELNDTVPEELGKLRNLRTLYLTSNNLTGNMTAFKGLRDIQTFEVAGNYLSGPIPEFIASWTNLTSLNLIGNNFEGTLPPEIFKMKYLQYLMVSDLSKNRGINITNSVNLPSVYTLTLRKCNIVGAIPSWIGTLPSLRNLDLSFNNLSGSIPDTFENLRLYEMILTGNMLSGPIRDWINKTTNRGDFSENNFEVMENLTDVPSNTSKFSANLNMKSLRDIMGQRNCRGNKSKNHSLFINAGGEEVTIAGDRYDADNLTLNYHVAENWAYSCSGDFLSTSANSSAFIQNISCGVSLPSVPEAPLYQKARLCPQSLTYYGLCLREGNYIVKLHFAEIVFAKDEDYSSSGKRVFDIYIQGERVLKDFNIKAEAGGPNINWTKDFNVTINDSNLLTIQLHWAGKGSYYNPPRLNGPLLSAISVVTPVKEDRGLSTKQTVGIAMGSVTAAVLALLLSLAFMWRMGWLGDRELRVTYVKLRGKSYTVKQIKDATQNFSPNNEIGKGRFGTIYKAELPDQIVAVKKLSFQSKLDQIGTEVYALKQLRHDNVVELLDAYSRKDLHLLIYEYMEKGSLRQALFDDSNFGVKLDWETRVNICLGVARGLKYLHEDNTSGQIIHRNVKVNNIMLDGSLNAKISDLGLAKLYDEENPYKFIEEIGTAVYMAPEYAMRQPITVKADVYGYGIVVIEILSGKSNSKPEENQENDYLLNKACVLHSEKRHLELVDKNLGDDYDRQQAVKILDLAVNCVNLSPNLRPPISEVVSELEKISKLNIPASLFGGI